MYKRVNNQIEVFIVRLGGKSWLNRPRPWSIPKRVQRRNWYRLSTKTINYDRFKSYKTKW